MSLADDVALHIAKRLPLPDDFVRLIFLAFEKYYPGVHDDEKTFMAVTRLYRALEHVDFTRGIFPVPLSTITTKPYGPEYDTIFRYEVKLPVPSLNEHAYVIGKTGSGKTQLLQRLIYEDIREGHGVCVIAPKGSMPRTLVTRDIVPLDRLTFFHPLLPIGLNIFKIFGDNPTPGQENHIVELVTFAFGTLASAETTSKQSVLLAHCVRLLIKMDATLLTLRELIQSKALPDNFKPYLAKLNPLSRSFFEQQFSEKGYTETKEQLVWRIDKLLLNPTVYKLLTAKRCDFELSRFDGVVIIDTSIHHMTEEGSTFLGRCFIQLLAIHAQTRRTRSYIFCYVDECDTYLTESVNWILERAREAKVGIILAHQQLKQITPELEASILTNTSVKFIGRTSATDATKLAKEVGVDALLLQKQERLRFYMCADHQALQVHVPLLFVENQPRRTEEEVRKYLTQDYLRLSFEVTKPDHTEPDDELG